MSDTPRTDKMHDSVAPTSGPEYAYDKMIAHARQLERENAALVRGLDEANRVALERLTEKVAAHGVIARLKETCRPIMARFEKDPIPTSPQTFFVGICHVELSALQAALALTPETYADALKEARAEVERLKGELQDYREAFSSRNAAGDPLRKIAVTGTDIEKQNAYIAALRARLTAAEQDADALAGALKDLSDAVIIDHVDKRGPDVFLARRADYARQLLAAHRAATAKEGKP